MECGMLWIGHDFNLGLHMLSSNRACGYPFVCGLDSILDRNIAMILMDAMIAC